MRPVSSSSTHSLETRGSAPSSRPLFCASSWQAGRGCNLLPQPCQPLWRSNRHGLASRRGCRKTKIIAPAGFMEAVIGEAVVAGNAKARRAQYQFGLPLPIGERGNLDIGLDKNDSRGASGADRLSHQAIPFSCRWRPALSMELLSYFNLRWTR